MRNRIKTAKLTFQGGNPDWEFVFNQYTDGGSLVQWDDSSSSVICEGKNLTWFEALVMAEQAHGVLCRDVDGSEWSSFLSWSQGKYK